MSDDSGATEAQATDPTTWGQLITWGHPIAKSRRGALDALAERLRAWTEQSNISPNVWQPSAT